MTTRTWCQRNADTFGKLWRFLTDFKGTVSQKEVFKCVYNPIAIIKNIKISLSKEKSGVRVVVDNTDIRFSIKYLRENIFACSYWALVELKKLSKISWHSPFKLNEVLLWTALSQSWALSGPLKGQCHENCFQTETVGWQTRSSWCAGTTF